MPLTTIDKSITAQLDIIRRCLTCIVSNTLNAQDDIAKGHRNAAIGALLNNQELIHNLKTLHEAIFLIHRNADAFENQGEPHDQ
jgi:hypothetical protein